MKLKQPPVTKSLASHEAFGPKDRREFRAQDLDRDLAFVFPVLGKIHGRHPADAKLAVDFVAVSECSFEAVELVGHLALGSRKGLRYGSPQGTARNPAYELGTRLVGMMDHWWTIGGRLVRTRVETERPERRWDARGSC